MMRWLRRALACWLVPLPVAIGLAAAAAQPPEVVQAPGLSGASQLWQRPDGEIRLYVRIKGELSLLSSRDGRSWQTRPAEEELAGINPHGAVLHTDRRGVDHVFFLRKRCIEACLVPNRTIFIDVLTQSRRPGGKFGPARTLVEGYVGALRQIAETEGGRLVLPMAIWVPGRANGPPTGSHEVRVAISDDGEQWRLADAALTAPTPRAPNAPGFGAVEPSIARLSDGRLWLAMRTQTGLIWESFSRDGESWSRPQAGVLAAPSSPFWLASLPTGETLILLNNQYQPSRYRGRFVYGGRDLLHAALTRDASRFDGLREIYRDPLLLTPAPRGDFGTAYPTAAVLDDGLVLVLTGQGEGRLAWIRLDPRWLKERGRVSDGTAALVAFAEQGEAVNRKRPRVPVASPDGGLDLEALAKDGAALWNFPRADAGSLRLDLSVAGQADSVRLLMLDRFVNPGDPAIGDLALGTCELATPSERIELSWTTETLSCGHGRTAPRRKGAINYLYITATGRGTMTPIRIEMQSR